MHTITNRPQDTLFDQLMKFRMTPRTLVMTVGSIKYSAITVLLHPRPGFAVTTFHALHQNGTVIAQFMVNISLIPGGKGVQRLHGGMILLNNGCHKSTCVVLLKLASYQADVLWGVL